MALDFLPLWSMVPFIWRLFQNSTALMRTALPPILLSLGCQASLRSLDLMVYLVWLVSSAIVISLCCSLQTPILMTLWRPVMSCSLARFLTLIHFSYNIMFQILSVLSEDVIILIILF